MDKKFKLAVVGATGLVGRTALKVLEEKNLLREAPSGKRTFYVTKSPENFDKTANIFLGKGADVHSVLRDIKE